MHTFQINGLIRFFYVFYVFRTSWVHHKNCVWYLRYVLKRPVINNVNSKKQSHCWPGQGLMVSGG